jgi:hypothetical protein
LRVNGVATIDPDDPLIGSFDGTQLVVLVRAEHIFPNCPRYIHRMAMEELSAYAPAPDHEPPVPAWEQMAAFPESSSCTSPTAEVGEAWQCAHE